MVETTASQVRSDGIATAWDRLAGLGLVAPWLLAGYYLLQLLHLADWWPVLVVLIVAVGSRRLLHSPCACSQATENLGRSRRWSWLLMFLLIGPPAAQGVVIAWKYGSQQLSTRFFFSPDESYDLMIARGWAIASPPPDLSYAGTRVHYHHGLPLMIEFVHRTCGLPFHFVLYGIIPLVFKILVIAAVLRIYALLFPNWSLNRRLLAVLLMQGCLLIDPYNCFWNLRAALLGQWSVGSAFNGMPVAYSLASPFSIDVFHGQEIAVSILLILLGNIDRCRWIGIGSALFAIYLAKQQVFVPVAAAWGCIALWDILRGTNKSGWPSRSRLPDGTLDSAQERRRFSPAGGTYSLDLSGGLRERKVANVLAVAWAALLIGFAIWQTPATGGFAFRPALNDYFIAFARKAAPLAPSLVSRPVVAILLVLGGFVLGTHVFGLAAYNAFARGWRRLTHQGRSIVVFALVYTAAATAIMTLTRLRLDDAARGRFDEIYDTISSSLWLPRERYLPDMMNVSLCVALAAIPALFALLATGAVLDAHRLTTRGPIRAALQAVIVASGLAAAYGWTRESAWGAGELNGEVSQSAAESLARIPTDGGMVLTNDLRCPGAPHFPLMNAWAPQLFGHQFWASNFMFSDHSDSPVRLRQLRWFWSSDPTDEHRQFLRDNGIRFLFVRKDMPFPSTLRKVAWLSLISDNEDYLVFKFVDPETSRSRLPDGSLNSVQQRQRSRPAGRTYSLDLSGALS